MNRFFASMTLCGIMLLSYIPAALGCGKDIDCKGDRVCDKGRCVSPSAKTTKSSGAADDAAVQPSKDPATSPPPPPPPLASEGEEDSEDPTLDDQAPPLRTGSDEGSSESHPPPAHQEAEPAADRVIKKSGIMIGVDLGVNGATGQWFDQADPSADLKLFGMYRIVPYFAVGAKFAFLFHSVDATGVDTALTLIIAPELRGILPISVFSPVVDLDIWTSLSFGYSREMATGTVPSKGTKISSWSDGFSLGWGIGAEYYIIKQIGLGLNFELNKPWYTRVPTRACHYI